MSFDPKRLRPRSAVPAPLVGCWRNLTLGGFEKIDTNGAWFHGRDGWQQFTVAADGQSMLWRGLPLKRHLGSGQSLLGVWLDDGAHTDGAEYYDFKADGSGTFSEPGFAMAVHWLTDGALDQGQMAWFEARYGLQGLVETSPGVFEGTFALAWGGTFAIRLVLSGDTLDVEIDGAATWVLVRVDCATLT